MKRRNFKSIIAIAAALTLSVACFTGCIKVTYETPTAEAPAGEVPAGEALATGGVLCLKVNPEIAITYDGAGMVTKVEGRNDDGAALVQSYTGYEGKECRQVVKELVTAIGSAGYFVEEVEGTKRQITIEIESGSQLPSDTFMDDVVTEVRECVNTNAWHSPVDVQGESDYGITNYVDTDYGPENDGNSDYDDTDYGPGNDGVTDYEETTKKKKNKKKNNATVNTNNAGSTDYDDTDYGPNNDGVTDYNDTDYGANSDGVTDYNDTNYDDTNYEEVTTKKKTNKNNNNKTTSKAPANTSDYGSTNYDDGASNYDDGGSNYDDGGSNYDD